MTFIICSLDMPWDQLCLYIYNLSHQATAVRSDRFCFLHAVEMVLYMEHNEVVTFDSMESTTLGHLEPMLATTKCSIQVIIKGRHKVLQNWNVLWQCTQSNCCSHNKSSKVVDTAAEWVDNLLHKIDGLKLYKINVPHKNGFRKARIWGTSKMHPSRRKDVIGTRKVGRCIRNPYCSYDDCPFKAFCRRKK